MNRRLLVNAFEFDGADEGLRQVAVGDCPLKPKALHGPHADQLHIWAQAPRTQLQEDAGQVACVEVAWDDFARPLEPLAGWGVLAFGSYFRDHTWAKLGLDRL